MQIDRQAAVISGGGSGLGAGTARRLAALGAKVAVLDVNMDGANAVAEEVGGLALHCDVTSADSVETAVAAAADAHGAARICVNCAGIAPAARVVGREGPMALDAFARVINVNLIGSFNLTRVMASAMSTLDPVSEVGERGVVLLTTSVAAYDGQIGQAAYSASKGGVVGMTLPMAREFSRFGIRVMTIAPGIFGTPMLGAMPQEVQDSLAAAVPFPSRLGTPEDYASLAQHIVENEMLNGEVIRLDGAIRLAPK